MLHEVQGELLALGFGALALVGGTGAVLRLQNGSLSRLVMRSSLCIVPGLAWATIQVCSIVTTGRVETRPPGDGLLLLGTVIGGLGLLVIAADDWKVIASRIATVALFVCYGVAWVVGACVEIVAVTSI